MATSDRLNQGGIGTTTVLHEELRGQLLAVPEVGGANEELEPAYQVARLRIMWGLTQ